MKSHLLFNNPIEGSTTFKGRPGGGGKTEEEKKIQKDYTRLARDYGHYISRYRTDEQTRYSNRSIEIDQHFDLIELNFFKGFDQEGYQSYYYGNFGLVLVHLSSFNRKGLFAIEDRTKFDSFFNQFVRFRKRHIENRRITYDGKITFIKSFKLFSINEMFGNFDNYEVVHLSFLGEGSFIENSLIKPQKERLERYLNENNINYLFNTNDGEIYNVEEAVLREILNSFDFIYASCSGSGAIISPGKFNTPVRDFGFEINEPTEDLPIIGIIDTGISEQTPLSSLLVGENGEFDTTGTGSFIDNVNHGTGVACFAAFGSKLIPEYRGRFDADAKILPIKILDSRSSAISQQNTINLIREAHLRYGVKIFTLTIGYTKYPLKDNQEFSSYAAMLDEISNELDILIFISTTNNVFEITGSEDYPVKFRESRANIAPPAESMNNITIGAEADNFENNGIHGLAGNKDFPGIYSRKFHYNFEDEDIFNSVTNNKHLRKPDALIAGGDHHETYYYGMSIFDDAGATCLNVLSSNLEERTFRALGTSYSAPFAANIAAKLCRVYPSLSMQSIKALMINGTENIELGEIFNDFSNIQKDRILGYGKLKDDIIFSEENKVTLILEDNISADNIKLYPLEIPEYLNDAKRKNALLNVSATLCFTFKPKRDNQLLYCPLHLSFAIGKNIELNVSHEEEKTDKNGNTRTVTVYEGYNGNSSGNIKLSKSAKGWSQDYYYKEKIVSNTQKLCFNIPRQSIMDESNSFKIAISSAFHKMLSPADRESYNGLIDFSLVMTIEQNPIKGEVLNSLYDELVLVNELESIAAIDLEAEAEF